MNDVIFIKGQGGLGRTLPGQDYISGMAFYTDNLPSGFTTSDNIKEVFQVADAESLGILADWSDETRATATITVTGVGAAGDKWAVAVTEPNVAGGTTIVQLCSYTVTAADVIGGVNTLAASLDTAINANSLTNATVGYLGYTATVSTDTVSIKARTGMGIALNSGTPLAVTITGTGTYTKTQFAGGAYSEFAIWHYHIKRFFDKAPQGVLYVAFFPNASEGNFTTLNTVQAFSQGTIRQFLVYTRGSTSAANIATHCSDIQAAELLSEALHMPYSVVYATNIKNIADLSTLLNLGTLKANKASVCISQDGLGLGAWLYLTSGLSITDGGACLGTIALAKVSEDIAWVAKFDVSNGIEDQTPAFANGQFLSAISANLQNQLNNYRYIFLRKFVGQAGSYWCDSNCAVTLTSDYAYIENNRTPDKATRITYASLLPQLNSPLIRNADGTLSNTTIAFFTGLVSTGLDAMVRNTELSAYTVNIPANQTAIDNIVIYVGLTINGVARTITVNIGLN
jgi:hypothetical protein